MYCGQQVSSVPQNLKFHPGANPTITNYNLSVQENKWPRAFDTNILF
jgi:hypothetical protein